MQRGRNIGKVGISYEESSSAELLFHPAVPKLKLKEDGSYLIVGGFKGFCGNSTTYLARQGAKNIVAISRNGDDDAWSQKTIHESKTLGCTSTSSRAISLRFMIPPGLRYRLQPRRRCDMRSRGSPRPHVRHNEPPLQEFREHILLKVADTWNIHLVSQEQCRPLDFSHSYPASVVSSANSVTLTTLPEMFTAYSLQHGVP